MSRLSQVLGDHVTRVVRFHFRKLLMAVVLSSALACEATQIPDTPFIRAHISADPSQERFELADSAGVEIVFNGRAGAWGADLLSAEPVREIGVVEGDPDLELHDIMDVALDDDGGIYVTGGAGRAEIRVFDPHGKHIRTLGREGEGPGEFDLITSIFVRGDSLIVNDGGLNRVTVLAVDGRLIDIWASHRPDAGRMEPVHRDDRGTIVRLVTPTGGADARPGEPCRTDSPQSFHGFNLATDSLGHALVVLEGSPGYGYRSRRIARDGESVRVTCVPLLFSVRPSWAFDGRGRLYVTTQDDYRIDVHERDGELVRAILRDWTPFPVDRGSVEDAAALVRYHFDSLVAAAREEGDEQELRSAQARGSSLPSAVAEHRDRPLPAVEPPLGRILVSPDGSFWVERLDAVPAARRVLENYTSPSEAHLHPTRWDLFDAEGRFLGTTELPTGFSPRIVRELEITGVRYGSLGVSYVTTYRVIPPEGVL